MADEIYTVAQTAQYLKVCDKTVRRLIARGLTNWGTFSSYQKRGH